MRFGVQKGAVLGCTLRAHCRAPLQVRLSRANSLSSCRFTPKAANGRVRPEPGVREGNGCSADTSRSIGTTTRRGFPELSVILTQGQQQKIVMATPVLCMMSFMRTARSWRISALPNGSLTSKKALLAKVLISRLLPRKRNRRLECRKRAGLQRLHQRAKHVGRRAKSAYTCRWRPKRQDFVLQQRRSSQRASTTGAQDSRRGGRQRQYSPRDCRHQRSRHGL